MPSPIPHWAGEREAIVRGMWIWHQRAAFESWLCHLLAGMMNAKQLEWCLARGKHPMNIQTTAASTNNSYAFTSRAHTHRDDRRMH